LTFIDSASTADEFSAHVEFSYDLIAIAEPTVP